jgi:hypothetical protein
MRHVLFLAGLALALSACTEPNPGYEAGSDQGVACTPGSRSCSGQSVMVCVPSGSSTSWQLDRACPPTSTCKAGICTPGAGACTGSCEAGLVCTVFVNPATLNTLGTYCAKPVGSKPGGATCASDAECVSGLCVSRGKARTCYQACGKSRLCPAPTKCAELTLTVNGVQGTVSGCVF